jgi:membrane protein
MSSKDRSGPKEGPSPSDGLLTAGVLAISLIRGVTKAPVDRSVTERDATSSGRPSQRGEGRPSAYADLTDDDPPGRLDIDRAGQVGRGRQARKPSDMTAVGFRDVASRVVAESKNDNLPLLAAGVAFYSVMALFPALVAVVSIYGLVADPAEVARQLQGLTSALPAEAADIIVERVEDLAAGERSSLGISAAIGIGIAVWSASSGMSWMLRALTLIYDEKETRTFVPLRARALLLTFCATVGLVVCVGLIAGASSLAERAGLGDVGQTVVSVVRWPVLAAVMLVGLSALYRYGPDRDPAAWRWVTWGSGVGMLVWMVASVGFAVYVAVVGNNESYGSLAGVIVLMLWLWLTCVAILLGAQVNAELEHQTARDTTSGAEQPLGRRGAVVADSVGPTATEVKAAAREDQAEPSPTKELVGR